jgi:RNA polymerase sigma factor (sigma-70 family)
VTRADTDALWAIVLVQRPRLVRQLGADDASDALHEVYIAAASAVDAGVEIRNLEAYVRGIARVKAIEEIRRRRRRRWMLALVPGIPDRQPGPERLAIERERREQARLTLEALAPRGRDILVRFYVLEQSKEEIMAQMDLSENTFRLLKGRSRARAARILARTAQSKVAA